MMPLDLDRIDRALLDALQRDAGQSQRALAEHVGLSQNACWRRLKRLQEGGLILGTLIGAVLLGILNNGLNLMGINPYLQDVIKGLIILLAIYIGREW